MKPYEKRIIRLNVKSIVDYYTNSIDAQGVAPHYVHSVAEAHLPGNADMRYIIVDEDHLIKHERGVQELSLRRLSYKEIDDLKKLPTTSQWHNPSMSVFKTQWPINVKEYFRLNDWPRALDIWITERLDKDPRIVDCQKSITIPLSGDPSRIQPLNAHSIWLTNTGVSKSFYAILLGGEPIQGATQAGAIGSYDQTKYGTVVKHGFLHGEGFPVLIDEINTNDKPLIQKLLTYLENGRVWRGLKEPILLEGTKTVVLTGNPSKDDLTISLADFVTIVCTADEPQRIGRRFGFLLIGDDYRRVEGDGAPSLRHEVRRVIQTTIRQYRAQIQGMIESQMDWITTPEPKIEQEIRDYADATPIQIAAEFVRGQSYGCIKKLKMAAIRYTILEQLDRAPDDTVDFTNIDKVFQRLLDINLDSWRKLALIKPPNITDKQIGRAHV